MTDLKKSALFLVALILAATFLSVASVTPVQSQAKKVVGLDLTYRMEAGNKTYRVKDIYTAGFSALIAQLNGNLTSWGYQVKEINGLTSANLQGVDALVLAKILKPALNYTSDEISSIASWFKSGGKFLWVGSDSDFIEPYYTAPVGGFKEDQPNKVLAAIGSALRIEYCSVEDAVGIGAAGAAYRVYANATAGGVNTEGVAGTITKGAPRVIFHGPSIVVGFKDGKFVPFDQVQDGDNTFWLYRTSEKGTIVHNVAYPAQVVSAGQKGRFVLAAAQRIRVDGTYSKVLAAGESIMGDRNGFRSLETGVTLFGPTFVHNAMDWGTTVEQAPFDWTPYLIAAVVAIVAIVAAVVLLRRRKKA